jgi:hypothetical protein
MADPDERRRVLDMLAEGRISADDAANLLKALGEDATPGAAVPRPARKGTARNFRISIDVDDGAGAKNAKIRVNIPVGLARFASRFLPPEAKAELDAQGIDLAAIIDGLGDDVPEGPLVDIDVDDGSGAKQAKIIIEVV